MDEAEYCHRIGLMVDGALVALDTPEALKRRHVTGRLVQLEGPGVFRAVEPLRALEGVLDVQPFGVTAHVLLDPARCDEERLRAALQGADLGGLTLQAIDPTLEDVFLAVVEAK